MKPIGSQIAAVYDSKEICLVYKYFILNQPNQPNQIAEKNEIY